jgi:hypothetical protein
MRFSINVVLPEPRNPVTIVTAIGGAIAAIPQFEMISSFHLIRFWFKVERL